MKVYLASWYASRDEMKARASELRARGIEVTSRWVNETIDSTSKCGDLKESFLRETARIDIEDILAANIVVLQTPSEDDLKTVPIPTSAWARGGRHFEAGFQYATMLFGYPVTKSLSNKGYRRLIIIGHKENVFHWLDRLCLTANGLELPPIQLFETWEQAKEYLVRLHTTQAAYAGD